MDELAGAGRSGTPIWPRFKSNPCRDDDDDKDQSGLVMSLNAGGDSQATLRAQIAMVHHCAFWDSVTPRP